MKHVNAFSCVNRMLMIFNPVELDCMIGFAPIPVGMLYSVTYNVLKTAGVIVSAKWLCAPPPVLVWTENALAFIVFFLHRRCFHRLGV